MAIYAIGANYDGYDVSQDFIQHHVVGFGYTKEQAPELHQFIQSLKVGDLVYIKSYHGAHDSITVKAVGIIQNNVILNECFNSDNENFLNAGRSVYWIVKDKFKVPAPNKHSQSNEKNNVRNNTMYEEFHPDVQQVILRKLFEHFRWPERN